MREREKREREENAGWLHGGARVVVVVREREERERERRTLVGCMVHH